MKKILVFWALFVCCYAIRPIPKEDAPTGFQIGTGIYDITGPAAEVGMMGYAMPDQYTTGVSMRLRARAFVFSDGSKRVAFVSTDSCMIFTGIKSAVVQKLQILYGTTYTDDNVMLSGTHTHSGPAGYAHYLLYNICSLGFHKDNYDVIVNGIVRAIQEAHSSLSAPGGKILINKGELLNSNINRSPTAYLNNPATERAQYQYDVDKEMTLLRLEDANGQELGMLNWFSVHGTSMNNRNKLISGDNKGYASYVFEKTKNGADSLPGTGPFVAAFAQSNEGDVSPNTRGAFCDNGKPCEEAHSTCGGTSEGCHGYGPGKDDFESTQIIGTYQFKHALKLYETATTTLQPSIDYIHTYLDMYNITVDARWTSTGAEGHTCVGALGDSFAAGTTDGPGAFDFTQGTNSTSKNPYWNFIAGFLSKPSAAQIACHAPKPILLNTGDMSWPAPFTPRILPIQIFRIGSLYVVGVPGEFSTMSGRRLRNTVRQALSDNGVVVNNTYVVIAGLANAYSHYITTFEEYSYQRYEGASTLYGPHTLSAYQQEYYKLATALTRQQPVPPGPTPPDLSSKTFDFLPPVIFDAVPPLSHFGAIYTDVKASYSRGQLAEAVFYGANPRNDLRTQDTFLTVERRSASGNWTVILTDGDFETRYRWQSHDIAMSLVTVQWFIPQDAQTGTYRLRTFGTSKSLFGSYTPYTGTSASFTVL